MQEDKFEFSVIIPTYNRVPILKRCVKALRKQTIPKNLYEIIVSDDGTKDEEKENLEEFLLDSPVNTLYLLQPNSGANKARNNAIKVSSGRILLFVNDDTIATPDLLKEHQHIHALHQEEFLSVLGRMTISPNVPYSIFAKLHLDDSYSIFEGKSELDWKAFFTCNVSVKKSFLIKYGLFEESIRYHEDLELSERLSHHGLKIIYNPKALGLHDHFLKEKDFLGVAKREGHSMAVWQKKSPHITKVTTLGFLEELPLMTNVKYKIADLLINKLTTSVLLIVARFFIKRGEFLSILIYRKLYQSIKRKELRSSLRNIL